MMREIFSNGVWILVFFALVACTAKATPTHPSLTITPHQSTLSIIVSPTKTPSPPLLQLFQPPTVCKIILFNNQQTVCFV